MLCTQNSNKKSKKFLEYNLADEPKPAQTSDYVSYREPIAVLCKKDFGQDWT